jgi:hypothetical protein
MHEANIHLYGILVYCSKNAGGTTKKVGFYVNSKLSHKA